MRPLVTQSFVRLVGDPTAAREVRTGRRALPRLRATHARRVAVVAVLVAFTFLAQIVLSADAESAGAPNGLGATLAQTATAVPPNVILIVTDDQRADTLRYMPIVRRRLGRHGVTFERAYVVNPVCCPSRATMLTGQHSNTTGVYTNHSREPYGGFPAFSDGSTIATWLDDAGYRTALIGKYLNGYDTTYVPPGWDRWFSTSGGGYYDYQAVSDGRLVEFGDARDDYGTNVLADEAVEFIRTTPAAEPLFLFFAPHAPHEPAIAAPGDGDTFRSLSPWRPRNYDEEDVSDKADWLRSIGRLTSNERNEIDAFRERQIRSLAGVDRAVGRLVDTLQDEGRLRDTMIVFTSDNGMLWGEHRLFGKGVPYEEATRVPYVVRFDRGIERARVDDRHLVLNLDLAPTFAAIAGVDAPNAQGLDFAPVLAETGSAWRSTFLIEHLSLNGNGAPTFCAAHTRTMLLVAYGTGERELYDLDRDPLQLRNRAGDAVYADEERALMEELRSLCQPEPPEFDL